METINTAVLEYNERLKKEEEEKLAKKKERFKKWYAANREQKREDHKKWCATNPERVRRYAKEWIKNNRERTREHTKKAKCKHKYGITLDERNAMLAKQGNCCAICGATEPNGKHGWHTDHCHTSKTVRGVLCRNCNLALGYTKDSITILKKMITYLERYDHGHD